MSAVKIKSFVKEFIAIVNGDNAEAAAQKALRQAESALKTQIASLEGDTISKEDAVEQAKETLSKAIVNNGTGISNRDAYVQNLLSSKNNVTKAEEALELHKEKIAFLKETLEGLDK